MIKQKITNILLYTFILILLINCKSELKPEKKVEQFISELNLTENLNIFTSKMTDKDTLKIIVNLTMENWIRVDELTITRLNDEIQLLTTEKRYSELENQKPILKKNFNLIILNNKNNEFEKHFYEQIDRIKEGNKYQWIYKVISQKDTLTFHTTDLGDKGIQVEKYFEFMTKLYPNENDFKPLEKRLLFSDK